MAFKKSGKVFGRPGGVSGGGFELIAFIG